MRGIATRRLRYAIAASLLLHLLLLWPGHSRSPNQDAPALLRATLSLVRQAPVALAPPKPPQAVARPHGGAPGTQGEPLPTPAMPLSMPGPGALERSKPVPAPPALAPSVVPAAKPAPATSAIPEAVASTPALPSAGSASGSLSLLTDVNTSGEALDGLRGYRLAVATQARSFKRYPAQAMAYGWAGSVDIRVEVERDGQPRGATVTRSSGHEALDRAALAMIDAGALRARLPESLRGRAFAIVLPVLFSLDDE